MKRLILGIGWGFSHCQKIERKNFFCSKVMAFVYANAVIWLIEVWGGSGKTKVQSGRWLSPNSKNMLTILLMLAVVIFFLGFLNFGYVLMHEDHFFLKIKAFPIFKKLWNKVQKLKTLGNQEALNFVIFFENVIFSYIFFCFS